MSHRAPQGPSRKLDVFLWQQKQVLMPVWTYIYIYKINALKYILVHFRTNPLLAHGAGHESKIQNECQESPDAWIETSTNRSAKWKTRLKQTVLWRMIMWNVNGPLGGISAVRGKNAHHSNWFHVQIKGPMTVCQHAACCARWTLILCVIGHSSSDGHRDITFSWRDCFVWTCQFI